MLQNSKSQNTLLAFFHANPERYFFLGDLQKQTKIRNVATHLSALLKENILESFVRKGKRYFKINKKHRVFDTKEIAILKKKWKREDELQGLFKKFSNLKKAVLSGIFVSENQMPCDLLLVGKVSDQRLKGLEKKLEKLMGQEINYALFSVEEYQHRKNIFDRFMKDIFENDHLVLVNKIKE